MSSMFSSIFSRDPLKDFAYELGELLSPHNEFRFWALHKAKKKASGEEYGILAADLAALSEEEREAAKAAAKRLKTMKHPSILNFVDSLETDKVVWVVTEAVRPLETYLKESEMKEEQRELAISWGLYQLASVLRFLGEDAKLVHNSLSQHAIYVNGAGEWRLAGLEYLLSAADITAGSYPRKPCELDRYSPPEMKSGNFPKQTPWSVDSWGLGCVIWEAFNGQITSSGDLRSPKRIPKTLSALVAALLAPNPAKRPPPGQFLKDARKGFLKNKFVDTLLFLEEFQLKEAREKSAFFNTLREQLDLFPADLSKRKILPQLVHAYQYGEAGSSVLAPLFRLGKLLNEEEYQREIVPCVVKLFGSSDRATRVKLLDRIADFVSHLTPPVVNDKIFPQLVPGFMDTNPAVRESTVKAMIHLAPKLSHNNLNVELMKHFARLQSPAEPQQGIRTNTTICLGKIGTYLHPKDREKILVAAFTRALKDPFPPARSSGILGLSANQQYYRLTEVANKVLPALSSSTVDPEKQVRDQAFKAIRGFLEKLEKASENPDSIPEMEAAVTAGGGSSLLSTDKVPAWAGWALGALSGKFYKSASPSPAPGSNPEAPTGSPIAKSESAASLSSSLRAEPKAELADGWDDDDDWGAIDESPPPKAPVKKPASSAKMPAAKNPSPAPAKDGWDDEEDDASDWDEDAFSEPKPAPAPAFKAKPNFKEPSPKPSPPPAEPSGWGDEDEDGWAEPEPTKPKAVPSAARNEERKAALAAKRAEKAKSEQFESEIMKTKRGRRRREIMPLSW